MARILIADDDRVTSTLLRGLLKRGGHEVLQAANGAEAVQRFFEHYPDLLVVDLMMPVLNGDLVCQLLRRDPHGARIPILLLTADEDRSSQFWGKVSGADRYLPKRFQRERLLEIVAELLESKPPPEELPEPVELTTVEVLERVSRQLDEKLFLATVQSQMLDTGSRLTDYEQTLAKVFELIAQVANFELGAFQRTDGSTVGYLLEPEAATLMAHAQRQLGITEPEQFVQLNHRDAPTEPGRPARGFFAMKLQAGGQSLGTLALASGSAEVLGDKGRTALRRIRTAVGSVINTARMYHDLAKKQEELEYDLAVARSIQGQMLPTEPFPPHAGLEAFGLLEPAKEVGGDYYHYGIHDGRPWVVIGDVAGKGVAASLIVSAVHTMMAGLLTASFDPTQVLDALNEHCYANYRSFGRFMSMCVICFDPAKKRMEVAGAGHEALLIRRASGDIERMPVGGMVLGVRPQLERSGNRVTLQLMSGDSVLLYSDGVTEAVARLGGMYGIDRLEKAFTRLGDASPQEQVEGIRKKIKAFAMGAEPHDDLTLVSLRVT